MRRLPEEIGRADVAAQRTKRSVHYFNLKGMFGALDRADAIYNANESTASKVQAPIETVCSYVFETLRAELIMKSEGQVIRNGWTVYNIRHNSADAQFRELMLNTYYPESDSDWLNICHNEELSRRRIALHCPTSDNPGTEHLELLLRYFVQTYGLDIVVLLDNIDRYSLRLQQDVIDKCIDFASMTPPLMTPVVAVRSSNFRRLHSECAADYVFYVAPVRSRRFYDHRVFDLTNDDEILAGFVRRRLDLAGRYLTENAQLVSVTGDAAIIGRFLDDHVPALQRIAEEAPYVRVGRNLSEWHNDSLRDAATAAFNWINRILLGESALFFCRGLSVLEPAGIVEATVRGQEDLTLRSRMLRNSLYRHLIFPFREPPAQPEVPNLFFGDLERQGNGTNDRFHFLPLRILEYLRCQKAAGIGRTSVEALLGTFEGFQARPEEVFRAVSRMAEEPRAPGVPRFLLLDIPNRRLGEIVDELSTGKDWHLGRYREAQIELLPAGHFLLDRLAVSCEYLFWMALCCRTGQPPLFEGKLTADRVLSDVFRFEVAARFLVREIVPRFERERAWVGTLPAAIQEKHSRFFAPVRDPQGYFPAACRKSLESFLKDIVASPEEVKRCHALIRTIPKRPGGGQESR
jgi:hypothetical protein